MRIGLDVGTTSCKAVVFNDVFEIVDSRKSNYTTYTEQDGYATQNPSDIIFAVKEVLTPLIASYPISTISLSTAMHSMMLEGDFDNLTEMIIWSDTRAASVVSPGMYPEVYLKTGLPVHPMSPFAKLLWFQSHEPESIALSVRVRDIKSLVFNYLTGEDVIDYSCASGTGLFNIHDLTWDSDILDMVGIDETMLPKLVDVDYVASGLILTDGIDVHIGASDGCLSNLGLGAIHEGDFAINLGTSAAIRTITSGVYINPEIQNFCYYLKKNHWVVGHASSNAGNVFTWLQSLFAELKYSDLGNIIHSSSSDNLIFMPYINGERSPHWDGSDRGAFLGLSRSHTKEQMIKSAFEGVFYGIRSLYELMPVENTGVLRVSGGLLDDPAMKHLFSDIMDVPFELINYDEAACLGAVKLLFGEDVSLDVERVEPSDKPHSKGFEHYKEVAKKYRELLVLLRENK